MSEIRAKQLREKCEGQSNIRTGSNCTLGMSKIEPAQLLDHMGYTAVLSGVGSVFAHPVATSRL